MIKKLKLAYIHGSFSAYNEESDKVIILKKDFNVCGISYSTSDKYQKNIANILDFCKSEKIDFVVGNSLGGTYALEVSNLMGIPAILINPCVEPRQSLLKIVGSQKNYSTEIDETLTIETVNSYPETLNISSNNLFLLGMMDKSIDPLKSKELALKNEATVSCYLYADHYWEDFSCNDDILEFLDELR